MFKSSTRARQNGSLELESSQPLLDSRTNPGSQTIFNAGDDDDDLEGSSALVTPKTSRGGHTVTFSEEVQLIAPPLRSTTSSREARMSIISLGFFGLY